MKLPPEQVQAQRWRLPDGSFFYPPRFRWRLLVKAAVEQFVPLFVPGGVIAYLADAETQFAHLDTACLTKLGIALDTDIKMPDAVVHDLRRNWLFLIEAVVSTAPVDDPRRAELTQLFKGSTAGLVFVTAFETRKTMQPFATQISWKSEVWLAEAPDHLIHFNGERFLSPYPDAMPHNQ